VNNSNIEILTIKSTEAELFKVEVFLKDIFKKYLFPSILFNKVLLCISEAIINSIQHGNKRDLNKDIFIKVNLDKDYLCIEIRDQGDGFDIKRINDPTKLENIKKESGRGLLIMKSLSDSIEYKDSGSCICLKFEFK